MKNRTGFTLLEVLIVVAIISILVVIFSSNFSSHFKVAQLNSMKGDSKMLETAVASYAIDHKQMPIDGNPSGVSAETEQIINTRLEAMGSSDTFGSLYSEGAIQTIDLAKLNVKGSNAEKLKSEFFVLTKDPLKGEVYSRKAYEDREGEYNSGLYIGSPIVGSRWSVEGNTGGYLLGGVEVQGNSLIGGGIRLSDGKGVVSHSYDGITWTHQVLSNYLIGDLERVGSGFVAVGPYNVYFSQNGIDWSENTPADACGISYFYVLNDEVSIVDTCSGSIYSTSDMVTWMKQTTGLNGMKSYASNGSVHVIVDHAGGEDKLKYSSSINGPWTTATSNSGIQHINYNNGTFLAVGSNGFAVKSNDGITWDEVDVGNTGNLEGSIVIGNKYYISVVNGDILNSYDAENWELSFNVGGDYIQEVVSVNGYVLGYGVNGTIYKSKAE